MKPCPALVVCMGNICRSLTEPDPYYGGAEAFEDVLDWVDDACEGLLQQMNSGKLLRT